MSKSRDAPQSRRHIWIEDETWDRLTVHFGETIGPSAAIRKILKAFFVSVDAKAEKKVQPLVEIDLENE